VRAVLIAVGVLVFAGPASAQVPESVVPGATDAGVDAAADTGLAAPLPGVSEDAGAAVDEVSDRAIAQRLRSVLSAIDELAATGIEVRDGVVHLTGEVAAESMRNRAEELTEKVPGVLYVDNDLQVATEVGDRLEPTLGRVRQRLDWLIDMLPLIGLALVVVIAFWGLARLVLAVERPFRLVSRKRLLRGIIRQFTATVVFLLGLLLALELLEATALVGAVLGAAGLIGLALGFAFRDIGENYLASILLGLRQPFSTGDHVIVDDHEGKVVRLTTRETILMTLDGNHVRLPNALVYKSVLTNYTRNPLRRFSFEVGVGNAEDLSAAQRIGIEALAAMRGVAGEPAPFSRVELLGDWSVQVKFFGWVDQREFDWFKVRSEAIRRVKLALDDAGVDMPVPVQRVELLQPGAPAATAGPSAGGLPGHEIEVDHSLERQIEADREHAEEADLLQQK
jgi:small conductance mechanosensitive channel